jgi:SOS response regulatory protein OraA/RecX
MSTLSEIEAAADQLPLEQQVELLAYLARRLRTQKTSPSREKVGFQLSRRGFPVSRGHTPFTSEDVARLEAEVDKAG